MALENTPLSDGADDAGIAGQVHSSKLCNSGKLPIVNLRHFKRSKEAMTSTDLISESRRPASYSFFKVNCVAKTATHMHIVVHPYNAVQCV